MPLTYDFRKRRVVKTRSHRKSRETVNGQQAKVATCMTCPEKEKVAENMIFCRKYQFGVFVNLAQTTRVCEDFKEGDVHGDC